MDHIEAGKYWNENAEVWTCLARVSGHTGDSLFSSYTMQKTLMDNIKKEP